MDDTTAQVVMGVVVPVAAGFGSGLLSQAAATQSPESRVRTWQTVVALALPTIAAFLVTIGLPDEQWHRIVWIPFAGLLLGLVASCRCRCMSTTITMMILAAIAGVVILWPVIRTEERWWWIVTGVVPLAIMMATEPVVRRRHGVEMPFAMALICASAAAVITISGMMTLAVVVAAVGFAAAGMVVPILLKRRISFGSGAMLVVIPTVVLALIIRYLYAVAEGNPTPLLAFILAAATPLGLWLGELMPRRHRSGLLAGVLRVVGVLVIAAAAAAIAQSPPAAEEDDDPYADMYRDMMSIRLSSPVQ